MKVDDGTAVGSMGALPGGQGLGHGAPEAIGCALQHGDEGALEGAWGEIQREDLAVALCHGEQAHGERSLPSLESLAGLVIPAQRGESAGVSKGANRGLQRCAIGAKSF